MCTMRFGLAGDTAGGGGAASPDDDDDDDDGCSQCEMANWVARMGWVKLMSNKA